MTGPSPRLSAVRAPQDPSANKCHKGRFTPGQHREIVNVDGRTFTRAPSPSCAGWSGPTLDAGFSKFRTIDCRHRDGSFGGSQEGLAQSNTEGWEQLCWEEAEAPGNLVKKELVLQRQPSGTEECCDEFKAEGQVKIQVGWLVRKVGGFPAGGPSQALNTANNGDDKAPGLTPETRNRVRIEWKDCEGKSHFRDRSVQVEMDAIVRWNAGGEVIMNEVQGSFEEFFQDDTMRRPRSVEYETIKGTGMHGQGVYHLKESHGSKFRGENVDETAALIRISGRIFQ
jgi:hypothetical protein